MKHKMNRLILCLIIIFALAIAFFPFTTTEVISGKGHVLTLEKEKIGDCELFIEIKDVKSLLMRYRKSFSFVLDGTEFSEFDTYHDDGPIDGWCSIGQMYYDLTISSFDFCLLVYGTDLSYAALVHKEKIYFINPEENMPFSEIPYQHISAKN